MGNQVTRESEQVIRTFNINNTKSNEMKKFICPPPAKDEGRAKTTSPESDYLSGLILLI